MNSAQKKELLSDTMRKKAAAFLVEECSNTARSVATMIAEAELREEHSQISLEQLDVKKQRRTQEIYTVLARAQDELGKDSLEFFRAIAAYSTVHPELVSDRVIEDLQKLINMSTQKIEEKAKRAPDEFFSTINMQKLLEIDDASLNFFFEACKKIYDEQHYEKAAASLTALCFLCNTNPLFWLALGHAQFLCQKYDEALVAYAMVSVADPKEVSCHIQSAKCYDKLRQFYFAIDSLNIALGMIEGMKEHEALVQQITTYKNQLNTKK